MNEDGDNQPTIANGFWRVLPRWAQALSYLVGVPAWLVLVGSVLLSDRIGSELKVAAFYAFAAVCLLQMIFVFKALWRHDL